MEVGRVYGGGSDMLALLENSNNSIWVPSSSSPPFHDNMVNFDQESRQGRRLSTKRNHNGQLTRLSEGEETGGEEYEMIPYQQGEKKRRLTPEQVQFLEKSFEVENKLEPERKVELAKELGLQPRQVAIWFQNRRARYKTKQLEKDYDSLKASYENLKVDYDMLSKENENLQNEVKMLKKKLKLGDDGNDIGTHTEPLVDKVTPNVENDKVDETGLMDVPLPSMKQSVEDANSAKSDIFDSESPHCTEGNHSSLMEDPTDLQSDFSQGEDESLMMSKRLLLPPLPSVPLPTFNNFLKVEDDECYDLNASSCNFPLNDDQPFWSLLY